jgi:hypothetical protein
VTNASEQDVDFYVRRLLWALQALPQEDRLGISGEIHSHLMDCAARGPAELETAFRRLGAPDLLARSYVEDYELAGALNRAAPGRLMLTMLDRAGRSVLAFAGGLGAFILYALSAALAFIAIAKLIVPAHVGAWKLNGQLEFGVVGLDLPAGQELVGFWIIPLSAILAWVGVILAGKLLRLVGRRLLARPKRALPTAA